MEQKLLSYRQMLFPLDQSFSHTTGWSIMTLVMLEVIKKCKLYVVKIDPKYEPACQQNKTYVQLSPCICSL